MCFDFNNLKVKVLKSPSENMKKEMVKQKYHWNTTKFED